ncbi:thermostable hemolysin [Acinetobacter pittii]|uniref:thermostable hemolysin n=1 Tax=Acinetobacter pittii TaxID=48296 RepID=UPI0009BFE94C|nr:thermostable hemolysin [Acinetobacter pittii]PTV50759.1 hypothetical protein DBL01_01090 [Acinetobacter pittii]WHA53524.1 Glutathione S-transferase [Acinetobacter pittii]
MSSSFIGNNLFLPRSGHYTFLPRKENIFFYQIVENKTSDFIQVNKVNKDNPERFFLESFINNSFKKTHQAELSSYLSTLFSGKSNNDVKVAIGIESLKDHIAFLEQYLSIPVHKAIEQSVGYQVNREKVFEIGNLAAIDIKNAKLIIAFLVFYFSIHKVEWAVCTGTIAVRYALKQMGLIFHVLEKADPLALQDEGEQWGSYFEQKPQVLAIHVPQAFLVTKQNYSFTNSKLLKQCG